MTDKIANDNEIRQGFLCPECKTQFKSINELEAHFNSTHLNERNDSNQQQNNLGNHFNKFLGKAKKILKTEIRNEDSIANNELDKSTLDDQQSSAKLIFKYSESDCYFALRKNQKIGHSKDHFDELFKKIRNSKIERDVQETNKLLIRIDQLLQDLPSG